MKNAKKKLFALYLPQFHEIPENNEWWGKGYTEWNAVKKAKPFFKGHEQPKVPLHDNYYDLSDETGKVWEWQSSLAKNYGLNGFCIYHYWFKGCKKLLEKPMEILLKHKDIDIEYFVCWANEPWKRTWYKNEGTVLVEQDYGEEKEWEEHYLYLRAFFNDTRYLKIDGKPVIAIYKTADIAHLKQMRDLWEQMAKKDGFNGIYVLGAKTAFEQEHRLGVIDGEYLFEPAYTMHYQYTAPYNFKRLLRRLLVSFTNLFTKTKKLKNIERMDVLYKRIALPKVVCKDIYYGICPSWDNTPRKQENGTVFINGSPELFESGLRKMLSDNRAGDLIIINAWNEWGEGAILEPTEKDTFLYLESVKKCINND